MENRVPTTQESKKFDEELNRQMKNMPSHWYTEVQA